MVFSLSICLTAGEGIAYMTLINKSLPKVIYGYNLILFRLEFP